jgi:hypothetical protein
MNWPTVEAALIAWVQGAAGLADGFVVWSHQNAPAPGFSFGSLHLSEIRPAGGPDPLYYLTDLDRDEGEEVEERVSALRIVTLTVQMHSSGVTGATTARALLSRVQTALSLDLYRSALETAGLTPFDIGVVRSLPVIVGANWTGRAVIEVRFYAREELSAYHPYIDEVESVSYMGPPDEGTKDEIDI